MTIYVEPLYLLPALKGPPISCLYAIQCTDIPATIPCLTVVTGYSVQEVRRALVFLEEINLIKRASRRTWRLTQPPTVPKTIASNRN